MKRSKSYTWLSGLLRARADERDDEEWGAAPWVRADVMHHDRRRNAFAWESELSRACPGVPEMARLCPGVPEMARARQVAGHALLCRDHCPAVHQLIEISL
ncbi:hypothetical protein PYW07_005477 [Mythimna separata]|uniref:Uncharacterized protein n=1 Tax=Mythimna separata TaxID=271217 RepID=A0AAD7YI51_MYTSE|nr:hypothetical protein PYW07_005477 [Mythimna separata]